MRRGAELVVVVVVVEMDERRKVKKKRTPYYIGGVDSTDCAPATDCANCRAPLSLFGKCRLSLMNSQSSSASSTLIGGCVTQWYSHVCYVDVWNELDAV